MTLAEQIQHLYKQANDADPDEARTVFAALRPDRSAGPGRAAAGSRWEPLAPVPSPGGWAVAAKA